MQFSNSNIPEISNFPKVTAILNVKPSVTRMVVGGLKQPIQISLSTNKHCLVPIQTSLNTNKHCFVSIQTSLSTNEHCFGANQTSLITNEHCFGANQTSFGTKHHCFVPIQTSFSTNEHCFAPIQTSFSTNEHCFVPIQTSFGTNKTSIGRHAVPIAIGIVSASHTKRWRVKPAMTCTRTISKNLQGLTKLKPQQNLEGSTEIVKINSLSNKLKLKTYEKD